MSDRLPTREEIVEIIRVVAGLLSTFPKHANEHPEECLPEAEVAVKELLARLRPAWDAHEKCIEEIQRDQLAVAERENELHDEKDRQIDALRADLRACAEALVFADQCCRKPDDCKWGGIGGCGYESGGKLTRAALARQSVQDILRG